MKPRPAFDAYAADYDSAFTHSQIGRLQRAQVWKALLPYLAKPLKILEVNCGTGVDALWLAEQGHEVLATDISPGMIDICQQKLQYHNPVGKIEFQLADFSQLDQLTKFGPFDLIFSNFGGLNCIDANSSRTFSQHCSQLLGPKGLAFLVYISKTCRWENYYFRYQGDRKKAARRQTSGPVISDVEGKNVEIWYYLLEELKILYSESFQCIDQFPIGLFVPPSYMEEWFTHKPTLLKALGWLDTWCRRKSWADYGDHIGLVLKKS
ncbi:MAG: class I SAM-dependent methyltransferase [Saprospiraceae bacterium]|nr:class I SAM-dependent methyltransferase [Saprospiraceae bacterium]